jgi:hypothetical protein
MGISFIISLGIAGQSELRKIYGFRENKIGKYEN